MGSPLEVLANYNPTGFALANQQRQAQLAQTQAQTGAIASEVAGRQALTQEQLIKNQLAQRDLQDRDIMQRALANTDGSVEQVTGYALKNGISAPGYFGLQGQIVAHKQALQNLDSSELKLEDQRNDQIGGAFSGYQAKPQAERTPEDWNAARQKAVSISPNLDANLPAAGSVPTDADLAVPIGLVNYHGKQVKETLERAQASEAISKGKESDVKAQREQMLLDAWKKAQAAPTGNRYQFIDDQIPPTKSPAHAQLNQGARSAYDALLNAGASPEDAVKATAPFANHAAEIDKETNPAILQARRESATQGAVATEVAKAALAPGAVGQIRDPRIQQLALTEQAKAETDWHKAEGQANQLQTFVDLSRSGNQLASGLLPVAVVRELVNRVNNRELPLATGGVSVARRLENWLSRGAQGKPSADTLNDMEAFGKAILAAQGTIYRGNVAGTNRRTGSTFPVEPPVTPPPPAPTAPTSRPQAGGGPVTVTTRTAYDALPAGTPYIDSKGNSGVKGQK